MSKQKTILIVDGDVLCFRSAAAAETRSVDVIHKPSGRSRIFTTRTAFKDYLKGRDFEYKSEDYEFVDIQSEEDISHPLHSIKVQLKKMQDVVSPDRTRLFVGGKGNFREALPFPIKYKSSRKGMLRPIHLEECKEYCVRQMGAELIEGEEVDDALHYIGQSYLKKGWKVVVCTIDKDSHSHEGLHIYDFTKEKVNIWEVPSFGSLWETEKKEIKGNGFIWFAFQWGYGDTVDTIKPREVAGIKGFGEKAMYNLLKDCKTEQEAVDVVWGKYKEWYNAEPEYVDWNGCTQKATPLFMADMFFKAVRMKETADDKLDLLKFLKGRGLCLK